MNLDLIITELDMGGAERCFTNLALYLCDRGHRVRVISIGPPASGPRGVLVDQLRSADLELNFLGGTKLSKLPFVYSRLKQFVKSQKPDLAQSFLFHANVVCAAIYPKAGVPLVGGARVAEPRKWRHRWSRWAAARMEKVVCASNSVAEWSATVEKIPQSKLVAIPNGVTLRHHPIAINRNDHNIPNDARLLTFVGRLEDQKGVDRLVEAAPFILEQLPQHHIVLVGDGPLREKLHAQVAALGIGPRIHFVGWQLNPRDWLHSSDLVLLPARYEGMPNVLLEAMAESVAIASTLAEGVAEVLGPNAPEQTVQVGDWPGWSNLVVKLAKDDTARSRLGAANQAYCREHHELKAMLAKYETLYEEIVRRTS
jgi:glycosyltransferase involved in cell wall biosynthesis